jgi:hypothetical protein
MTTVPAGCAARSQPSSERKAGATDVHLGLELIGDPLTRDGSAVVKVRVGSSFPINGVLILLDEVISRTRSPVRANRATISSVMLTTLTIASPGRTTRAPVAKSWEPSARTYRRKRTRRAARTAQALWCLLANERRRCR